MVRGTPESRASTEADYRFDTAGVFTFMIAMVALQVLATQGSEFGWTSPITAGLGATALVVGVLFMRAESKAKSPFVNFALFKNSTYTGATISNFLLNGVAGMLLVSMAYPRVSIPACCADKPPPSSQSSPSSVLEKNCSSGLARANR
jgi:DHA2 family multidrug resistance protein-like MFS transporter